MKREAALVKGIGRLFLPHCLGLSPLDLIHQRAILKIQRAASQEYTALERGMMCAIFDSPIPVRVWTLDGNQYLGKGKIMGVGASFHALLNGAMLTPLTWGEDFAPEVKANLAQAGARLVSLPDDHIICMEDDSVLYGSQVSWETINLPGANHWQM